MTIDALPHAGRRRAHALADMLRDTRGAAATEYVILIAFAGLTTAAVIAGWLPRVIQENARQRAVLSQPYH